MKKLLILSLIFSIISFIMMILNFMASTDIYHDYVSKKALPGENITGGNNLPAWTDCTGEWQFLGIDMIVRFVFLALILFVLIRLIHQNKKSKTQ